MKMIDQEQLNIFDVETSFIVDDVLYIKLNNLSRGKLLEISDDITVEKNETLYTLSKGKEYEVAFSCVGNLYKFINKIL